MHTVDLSEIVRAISDYEYVALDFDLNEDTFRLCGYNAVTEWYEYDSNVNEMCGSVFNYLGSHIDDVPVRLLSELTGRDTPDLVALNKALGSKFFHGCGK